MKTFKEIVDALEEEMIGLSELLEFIQSSPWTPNSQAMIVLVTDLMAKNAIELLNAHQLYFPDSQLN